MSDPSLAVAVTVISPFCFAVNNPSGVIEAKAVLEIFQVTDLSLALAGRTDTDICKVPPLAGMFLIPPALLTLIPVAFIYCKEAVGTPETSITTTELIEFGAFAGNEIF